MIPPSPLKKDDLFQITNIHNEGKNQNIDRSAKLINFTVRSKKKLFLFIIFLIVTFTASFLQCDILQSYESNTRVKSFYGSSALNQYDLIQEFNSTSRVLIQNLYTCVQNRYNLSYDLNYIPITDLRILIRKKCSNNIDISCQNTDRFNISTMSLVYSESAMGYPIFVPILETNDTLEDYFALIEELITFGIFDNDVTHISLDVSFINPTTYMITYSELDYQIDQMGCTDKLFNNFSFRYNYYLNDLDYFRGFCEAMFFFCYIYYIIGESITIFYLIKHKRVISEAETQNKEPENEEKPKKIDCFQVTSQIFRGFATYFSKLENSITAITCIFEFFVILLWLTFITTDSIDLSIGRNLSIVQNANSLDIFHSLNQNIKDRSYLIDNGYYYLVGAFLFFHIIRLLIDFGRYSQIGVFYIFLIVNVIKKALQFLIFLFIFFAAFAVFLKNIFGINIAALSDGYTAGLYLFKILLSEDSQIEDMWRSNPVITTIFHLIYFLFIVVILMNMFLVITKNEFLRVTDMFTQEKIHRNPVTKKDPFKYKPCWLARLKNCWYSFQMLLLYCCKRKSYNTKRKEEESLKEQIIQESKIYSELDFNTEFTTFMKDSNKPSHHGLTDFEKLIQKKEKIKKFVIFIWKTVFITITFVLFSALIVYYFDSSISFQAINNVNMKFQTPLKFQSTNVFQINSAEQCVFFLENVFPNYFSSFIYIENENSTIDSNNIDFALMDNVFLVNNLVRLTIRKRKYTAIVSELDYIFPYKIAPTFSRNSYQNSNENTSSVFIKSLNQTISYNKEESFLGLGGYVIYSQPSNVTFKNLVSALYEENFLDMSLNSIVLDFVVASFQNKGMFLKCNIYFELADSGEVETHAYIMSFYRNAVEQLGDYFILAILLLISVFYVVFFVKTVGDIRSRTHNYNTWYTLYIQNRLPSVLLYHRETQKAEIIRKTLFVCSYKVMINLSFLLFSGGFLITVGVYELQIFFFESNASIFNQSVKNFLYDNVYFTPLKDPSVLEHYGIEINQTSSLMTINGFVIFFASCAAFVLVSKIFFYYSKYESFRLIMKTLKEAFLDFLMVLVIFLSILMAFVVCTYFAFGMKYDSFCSFDAAYYNLLVPMVYFENLGAGFSDDDPVLLVMLLLPYFVIFKLIWLNCIISIMFVNFQNFYQREKKTDETMNFKFKFKDFFYVSLDILRLIKKPTTQNANLRKNHDIIQQTLQKVNPHLPFIGMKNSIRNSERLKNVNVWADVCSEEIKFEYDSRKFLKDKCDELTKNALHLDEFGEDPYYVQLNQINFKRSPIEFELRKVFWDYFRIAHLYFHRYDYYLQNKINEILKKRKLEELKNQLFGVGVQTEEDELKYTTPKKQEECQDKNELVQKLEENIQMLKNLRMEEAHLENIIFKTED